MFKIKIGPDEFATTVTKRDAILIFINSIVEILEERFEPIALDRLNSLAEALGANLTITKE